MDVGWVPLPVRPVLEAVSAALRNREPAIRERVERLRSERPDAASDEIARAMIGETRRRVATTGALSGATAIVPGLGTIFAIGTVTGQSLYALEQEAELVMAIAMLYGHELTTTDDRVLEALVVVGIAGGAVKLRDNVLVAGGQAITVAAFRRVPGAFLSETGAHVLGRVLTRIASTRAATSAVRIVPLAVGLAAGAGFDWIAATALGRSAMSYYGPGGPAARRLEALPDAHRAIGEHNPASTGA